jgi:dihydrofolate reductase
MNIPQSSKPERMIAAGLFISLDGVVESPADWGFQYLDREMGKAIMAGIAQADTVLLGRRTYEEFARIWPCQGSDVPMADFLNHSPKYVVSSRIEALEWGPARLIKGDLVTEIRKLKRETGRMIQIPGSPTLVRSLLREGLLDLLSLTICPILVGSGMRLFDDTIRDVKLELAHSTPHANGAIGVTYRPAQSRPEAAQRPVGFPEAASSRQSA